VVCRTDILLTKKGRPEPVEQVQALVFKWMEDGVLSTAPRRDKALQRGKDGRRTRDSKDMPWVVTTECADKNIANKVISNIKAAELPPNLSPKARGSIRKWRPDNHGYEKEKKRKHEGCTAAERMAPGRPKTPPDDGNKQQSSSWQPAKDAKRRMAKILDNAKARLRNDSTERNNVEQAMRQMNMAPSEQQSMEIAAPPLAMEALHKDGEGSPRGAWQGGINKNIAASVTELMTRYRYLNR
jgi:hypothetical protein